MRAFDHDKVIAAQHQLEAAVLAALQTRHYGRESDPNLDAAMDHADDAIALTSRDLVRAIEVMPVEDRPIGWDKHSHGPFSTSEAVA